MRKERFFRVKKHVPFAGRKMKYVGMSPRTNGNYILALMSKDVTEIVTWPKGEEFEFSPEEVTEILLKKTGVRS